jgi:hypothetical protein
LHIHDSNPKAWGRFLVGQVTGVKDGWNQLLQSPVIGSRGTPSVPCTIFS